MGELELGYPKNEINATIELFETLTAASSGTYRHDVGSSGSSRKARC